MRRRITKNAKIAMGLTLLICSFVTIGTLGFKGAIASAASKANRTKACEYPINVKHYDPGTTSYNTLMVVESNLAKTDTFAELGGNSSGDEGVHWACNSWKGDNNDVFTPSGIIFIVKEIHKGAVTQTYSGSPYAYPKYTIKPDIDTSSGNDVTATLAGLVHWNSDGTSADQGAAYVGFCKKKADCEPVGSDNDINSTAAASGAGGIVKRNGSNIGFMRQVSGKNDAQSSYGLWTEPLSGYGNYFPTITINGKKLRNAVDDGSVEKNINSSGFGWVALYIHRCWSGDGVHKSGTCRVGKVYLTVQLPPSGWTATFSGQIDKSVSTDTTAKTVNGKVYYYTESEKPYVTFTHKVERTDNNAEAPASVSTTWKSFEDKNASQVNQNSSTSYTNSLALGKNSGLNTVHTHKKTVTLTEGQTKEGVCDAMYYVSSVKNNGTTTSNDAWSPADACVNFHRYGWYGMTGRVVAASDNTTEDGGYYWTEVNTANLRFSHQLKNNGSSAAKGKFMTRDDPKVGGDFKVQADYTTSGDIAADNKYHNVFHSPKDNQVSVNVAKDTGTNYCQYLNYYPEVREDSGNYRGTVATASKCIHFMRYKTTFSGKTEILLGDDEETNYDNQTYTVKSSKYTKYPATLKVTFKHTVTRSSSDEHGSKLKKATSSSTKIFDGESGGTYGYRSVGGTADPHGAALASAPSTELEKGKSDYRTDSFTIKIYPEQTIHLCQQMTYTSEIQGTEHTQSATGNKACVTITMERAACYDDEIKQNFGIGAAKNMMKVDIYKNGTTKPNKTSGIKSDGDSAITAWAKPGEQIRFNYEACAGGELARQYAGSTKTTSYDISAQSNKLYYDEYGTLQTDKLKSGYLFGDTLTSSPYADFSKNFGTSNATVGKGPFNEVYTREATSPSGDSIYSCDQFGKNNRLADFYRISNYISGVTDDKYASNCNSDDYGRASDLGTTIVQKVTWTDIQYSGGKIDSAHGHDGTKTASVTASVSVPYNYKTIINVSGEGGYILPGNKYTERIKLTVSPRKNSMVAKDEYATVTKESKYKLIEINVSHNNTTPADNFNKLVNDNLQFSDTTGSIDLSNSRTGLPVCKSFNCTTVRSGSGRYNPDNNIDGGQTITDEDYEPTVSYNAEPGTKICYIAAIWPSDSHDLPYAEDLTEEQNAAGLNPRGTFWHVSGATCYTVAKRPSINVLGGDTYAQGYISARTQKYPKNNLGTDPRIYGSWTEYSAISGMGLKGFASGASLWGGSKLVADTNSGSNKKSLNCVFSSYTLANSECSSNKLGALNVSTTSSSNPENIAGQMITRYTRSDGTGLMNVTDKGAGPFIVEDAGVCSFDDNTGTYVTNYPQGSQSTFACIGDTGAKYTHVNNTGNQVAYIPNVSGYCMGKGDTYNSRTSIIHSDGTLVVGANMAYGSNVRTSWDQQRTPSGLCWEDSYNSISEIPQSILIAKKIIIKDYVTYLDTWLIADEIITCDPNPGWNNTVDEKDINTKNCNQQLTINGPVMTKNLKLYRTYGTGFHDGYNRLASPAEIFTMGPEVYLWSYNQAQRYSQATTTYARELAPRY